MSDVNTCKKQRGTVLLVSLILLVMMTLVAVSGIRLASSNLSVIGNEQFRSEAENIAHYELELALNAPDITALNVNRTTALPAFQQLDGSDVVTTAGNAYAITVPPPCWTRFRFRTYAELLELGGGDILERHLSCVASSAMASDINIVTAAASNDNTNCALALWEATANVAVEGSGSNATWIQGIELDTLAPDASQQCL